MADYSMGMQVVDGNLSVLPRLPAPEAELTTFVFTLEACAASCGRVRELKLMLRRLACSEAAIALDCQLTCSNKDKLMGSQLRSGACSGCHSQTANGSSVPKL